MLKLDAGRIDLWLSFYDEITDDSLLSQYRSLLTEAEQRQEGRFYFAKDRHRYLVTRALVRTTLSKYAPIAAEDWVFTENAYGRPEIANDDPIAKKISFNISHTQSLIVLGVTCERALGVDTESTCARQASLDIANHFFSSQEVADLYALPMQLQHQHFFRYWTLKESYIKARGMGLSIPLDKFGFQFPTQGQVRLSIDASLSDHSSRWLIWQHEISADYLLAICVERIPAGDTRLVFNKSVPLESDEAVGYTMLCYSG